jgi:hypothetical protein
MKISFLATDEHGQTRTIFLQSPCGILIASVPYFNFFFFLSDPFIQENMTMP